MASVQDVFFEFARRKLGELRLAIDFSAEKKSVLFLVDAILSGTN